MWASARNELDLQTTEIRLLGFADYKIDVKVLHQNSQELLLANAWKSVSTIRKLFGMCLSLDSARRMAGNDQEMRLKICKALESGEKVWPFVFDQDTLAMRKGFVITKDGRPVDVLLTEVS